MQSKMKRLEKPFVICGCGAGSSGKTVTIEKTKELLEADGYTVFFMGSIVRGFYAKHNIKDQHAFFELPIDQKRKFQFALLDFYFESFISTINSLPLGTIILSDRSPFDHCAYTVNGTDDITLAEYEGILKRSRDFADEHIRRIIFFPYPTHFSTDIDKDPFRKAHPSQNLHIDGLMRRFASLHSSTFLDSHYSVDIRAGLLASQIIDMYRDEWEQDNPEGTK